MAKFGFDGREYKLLLTGEALPEAASAEAGAAFFEARLAPLIDELTRRGAGASRLEGRCDRLRRRIIRFWDLSDGFLAANGYSVRERLKLDPAGATADAGELTLKLRLADLFVAWATPLAGIAPKAEAKFEEDIAPLAVEPPAGGTVARPERAATHSRFSRSLSQDLPAPLTWGGALASFPTLAASLEQAGAALPAESRRFVAGPTIEETTWRGARLALGKGFVADFTLSLWRLDARAPYAAIGELSFALELGGAPLPLGPALRAQNLFAGLQSGLGDLLERRFTSKTAIALAVPAGRP